MKGTAVKHKIIRSYAEFKHVSQFLSSKGFLFRGQENQKWPIMSSFTRLINERRKANLPLPNELNRIDAFLRTKVASDYKMRFKNAWDILSVMQHYGIQTRLLDFTFDPFVAAFFAATEASYQHHLKSFRSYVYAISPILIKTPPPEIQLDSLEDFSKPKNVDISYPLFQYESPLEDQRIKNQKSVFIFMHNPEIDLERKIAIENNWNILRKERAISNIDEQFHRSTEICKIDIRLNPKKFMEFRRNLANERGICPSYIFPDEIGELLEVKYE